MKRRFLAAIAAILTICLLVSLTGCEKKAEPTPAPTTEAVTEPPTEAATEAETETTTEAETEEATEETTEEVTTEEETTEEVTEETSEEASEEEASEETTEEASEETTEETTEADPSAQEPVTGSETAAGTYQVDFAPLGAEVLADVEVTEDGEFHAQATAYGYDISLDGLVTAENDVYTLSVPGNDLSLKVTMEDGSIVPDAADLETILTSEMIQGFISQITEVSSAQPDSLTGSGSASQEIGSEIGTEIGSEVVAVDVKTENDLLGAIVGTYNVDLRPVGWEADVLTEIRSDGFFRAETEVPGIGSVYVDGLAFYDDTNETYAVALPDYDATMRFNLTDEGLVYNQDDYANIEGMVAAAAAALEQTEPEINSEDVVETNPLDAIAGTYGVDLRPVGWDASLLAEVRNNGFFRADTEVPGIGGVYVEGLAFYDGANETYAVSIPDFGVNLRFALTEEGLVYNQDDYNNIETMVIETMAALTQTAEVDEPNESAQADPLKTIAGTYSIDLRPVGWDATVTAEIGDDGFFRADTEVPGVGGVFVEGLAFFDDTNETYAIAVPDFGVNLRFNLNEEGLVYNQGDYDNIEAMALTAVDAFAQVQTEEVVSEEALAADTNTLDLVAGAYNINLLPVGWNADVYTKIGNDGYLYAETEVPGVGSVFVEGLVFYDDANGTFAAVIPDFGASIRFALTEEGLEYNADDFAAAEGLALQAIEYWTGSADQALAANPLDLIAGYYSIDLTPIKWDASIYTEIYNDGTFYADTEVPGVGTVYADGTVDFDGETGFYTLTDPEFNVGLSFALTEEGLVYDAEDVAGIETMAVSLMQVYNETTVSDESVNPLTAIAGAYSVDLAPIGWNAELYAEIDDTGYFYADTNALGQGVYVEGLAFFDEGNGVYAITVPEVEGATLRFSLTEEGFSYDANDAANIESIVVSLLEQTSASPVSALTDIAGSYQLDLTPMGYAAVLSASIEPDGAFRIETEVAPGMEYYVAGIVGADADGYIAEVNEPAVGVSLRFGVADGTFVPNEDDINNIEALIVENVSMLTGNSGMGTVSRALAVAEPVAPVRNFTIDLSPILNEDLTAEASVDAEGAFYASLNTQDYGDWYLEGVITEQDGLYTFSSPLIGVEANFVLDNGLVVPVEEDVEALNAALNEFITANFTDGVSPVTALAGEYAFDLSSMNVPIILNASVDENGNVLFTSTVNGVGYYVNALAAFVPGSDNTYELMIEGIAESIYFNADEQGIQIEPDMLYFVGYQPAVQAFLLENFDYAINADYASPEYMLDPMKWEYALDMSEYGFPGVELRYEYEFDGESLIYRIKDYSGSVNEISRQLTGWFGLPSPETEIGMTDGDMEFIIRDYAAYIQNYNAMMEAYNIDYTMEIPSEPMEWNQTFDLSQFGFPGVVLEYEYEFDGEDYLYRVKDYSGSVNEISGLIYGIFGLPSPEMEIGMPGGDLEFIIHDYPVFVQNLNVIMSAYEAEIKQYAEMYEYYAEAIEALIPMFENITMDDILVFLTQLSQGDPAVMSDITAIGEMLGIDVNTLMAQMFQMGSESLGISNSDIADIVDMYMYGVSIGDLMAQGDPAAMENMDIAAMAEMFGVEIDDEMLDMILQGMMQGANFYGAQAYGITETASEFESPYLIDFNYVDGINLPLNAVLEINPDMTFKASSYLDAFYYFDGVVTVTEEGYVLDFNGIDTTIRFTLDENGLIQFNLDDLFTVFDIPGVVEALDAYLLKSGYFDDPYSDVSGWYFVDLSPSGVPSNVFFGLDTDGTVYLMDYPDIETGNLYVMGSFEFDGETYYMNVPDWDVSVPFVMIDGDIALMPEDFENLIGFSMVGEFNYIEKVKQDGRNVYFYDPIYPEEIPSRDGVYSIDLNPAGLDMNLLLEIAGQDVTIGLEDMTVLAEGYITSQNGLLMLSVPDYGVYVDFIVSDDMIWFDAAKLNGIAGYTYDAEEIVGTKIEIPVE